MHEQHPEGGIDFLTISGHIQKYPDLVQELGSNGIRDLDREVGEIITAVCDELEAVQADTVGDRTTALHDGLIQAMIELSDRNTDGFGSNSPPGCPNLPAGL